MQLTSPRTVYENEVSKRLAEGAMKHSP